MPRGALEGAVQIDQVEPPGPLPGPVEGRFDRVRPVDDLALLLPLYQADAFSAL